MADIDLLELEKVSGSTSLESNGIHTPVEQHSFGSTDTYGQALLKEESSMDTKLRSAVDTVRNTSYMTGLSEMGSYTKQKDHSIDFNSAARLLADRGLEDTAENHNVINGLGSAVAEVLVENKPVPMERVGIQDHFGEVGKMPFLMEKFHMLPKDIVAAVKKVIGRK
jgi:hypothetical protein